MKCTCGNLMAGQLLGNTPAGTSVEVQVCFNCGAIGRSFWNYPTQVTILHVDNTITVKHIEE